MAGDIVAFIRARMNEDEREARAAFSGQCDPENGWGENGRAVTPHVGVIHEDIQRAHVVKWNPARVLRGVDAKRRILVAHGPGREIRQGSKPSTISCQGCGFGGMCDDPWTEDINECPMLMAVASEWPDHPDYRAEWAT